MIPPRVIVSDDPHFYNDRRATRRDNPTKKPKYGIGAHRRYSKGTMKPKDLEELGAMVPRAEDAYLFQWATAPRLDAVIRKMQIWGFRFVNVAGVWVKKNLKKDSQFVGTGRYVPGNVELVLFGINGKAKPWTSIYGKKPRQVVYLPQPRDEHGKIIHSKKPEEFQDMWEAWLRPQAGDAPFMELFATRQRPGWVCLGYDVTGRDIRADLELYRMGHYDGTSKAEHPDDTLVRLTADLNF